MESQSAKPQESRGFHLFNPEGMAKPTAGYSQVAEVTEGKIVYIAGQVALDKSGNLVGKDDFRAQAQQVFENLKSAVEGAGGDFGDVVKLNYYCPGSVPPEQIGAVQEIRDRYVNTASPPTGTFVFVQRLVRPEWLLEVEAVAVVKK
jgi:enamine deaminase RidA (YjgF/YER057c/UK114 family)